MPCWRSRSRAVFFSNEKEKRFDLAAAKAMTSAYRARWKEEGRRYAYEFKHNPGLFSETRRGSCEVAETVACTYATNTSDPTTTTEPGRISDLFDRADASLESFLEPDSALRVSDTSFILYEKVEGVLSEYAMTFYLSFDGRHGFVDSLVVVPMGPFISVDHLVFR